MFIAKRIILNIIIIILYAYLHGKYIMSKVLTLVSYVPCIYYIIIIILYILLLVTIIITKN